MKLLPTKVCVILLTLVNLIYCSNLNSQNWQLGGNAGPPLTVLNNYLGSDNLANIPMRIGTFGINRFFINNNTGPTAGFIGIGNNFTTPTSLLHMDAFGYNTGNLLRTDGSDLLRNQWQMFTGPNAGGLTEKFVVYSAPTFITQIGQPGTNHANIQASQGDIVLRAKGYNLITPAPIAQEVMRITRTQIAQPFGPGIVDEGSSVGYNWYSIKKYRYGWNCG